MTTDQTPPEKPARATPRGPTLQDLQDILVKLAADQAALAGKLDTLTALVQSALPEALVKLTWESLQTLAADAPQTRLRLLAPFKASAMNLAAGYEMDACDPRIKTHGRSMALGLATITSDAPAAMVRQIIADRATALAEAARQHTRAGRLVEAEAAQAVADKLTRAAQD